MPTVPNMVQPEALPGVRVEPQAADVAAFGGYNRFTPNPFQGASGLSEEVERFADQQKKNADDTATIGAQSDLVKLKNSLLYDPQSGAINQKGQNALGVLDTYTQKYDDGVQQIRQGLSNPVQQDMFDRMSTKYGDELNGELHRHVAQQVQEIQKDTFQNGISVNRDDAIQNFQNPDKVQESLGIQKSLLNTFAQQQGIPIDSDTYKNMDQEIQSKTHTGVIERMVDNGQDLAAKNYYDQNKDSIIGPEADRTARLVEASSIRGESQRMVDDFANRNLSTKDAMSEIRDIENPKLRDEVNIRYKQNMAEQQQLQRDVQAQQYQGITDLLVQSGGKADIPVSKLVGLPASDIEGFNKLKKQLVEGDDNPENGPDYYNMKLMAATPQTKDDFLKQNLIDPNLKVTRNERHELIELQSKLKTGDEKADGLLSDFRTKDEVVTGVLKSIGIDPNNKGSGNQTKVDQFRAMVADQQTAFQKQTGKQATNQDLDQIANEVATKVIKEKGFLWNSNARLFELNPGETIQGIDPGDVPRSERIKIEDALRKNNIPITDKSVTDLYTRKLQGMIGAGQQ